MSIRQTIERNPKPFMAVAIGVIVLSLVWSIFYLRGSRAAPGAMSRVSGFYYTDDDGKTFYPESFEKIAAPPRPGGKEWVQAHVCRFGNEAPFVAYLEKYTPRGRQFLEQFYSKPENKGRTPPPTIELKRERLVKKPGGTAWLSPVRDDVQQILLPPVRGDEAAQWVYPQ